MLTIPLGMFSFTECSAGTDGRFTLQRSANAWLHSRLSVYSINIYMVYKH